MSDLTQETETKEFKRSLAELKQGLLSLCAMLNKHGKGELWFGISPKGEAVGLDINEKTLRDVSQAIAAHIEPVIYPQIGLEIVQNKPCLKVTASGQQQPYFAYGRAYMRVADEDKKLSAMELKQIILQENREALRWDNEISQLSVEDLDSDKIQRYLKRAELAADSPTNALEKLELIKNGKLLKAAELFFGREPIELRCAVFATTESSTIIDMQDFHGDMLTLIDEAEKYILKNIHIGMRLEGMYRVDVPEIPVEAFREAIINAFCHRDWRDPGYIEVAVFKNRLEIRSPGTLFGGLTIERIRKGNVSRRRNPLIADLLRRVNLIEAWGRGMPKILDNSPNAKFEELAGVFIASFQRAVLVEENSNNSKETPKTSPKTGPKTGPKTSLETGVETPELHQQVILQYLTDSPTTTISQLVELTGLSTNGVKYHLRKLREAGKLVRHGANKGGYWEVNTDN